MADKLKQCPFCGGEVELVKQKSDEFEFVLVSCKNCDATIGIGGSDNEQKVTEAWDNCPSPWHTGTPTEEGWYVIKYRGIYGRAIGRTEYRAVHIYNLDGLPMIDGGIGADDVWKPIEWQKIEED